MSPCPRATSACSTHPSPELPPSTALQCLSAPQHPCSQPRKAHLPTASPCLCADPYSRVSLDNFTWTLVARLNFSVSIRNQLRRHAQPRPPLVLLMTLLGHLSSAAHASLERCLCPPSFWPESLMSHLLGQNRGSWPDVSISSYSQLWLH